MKKFLFVLLAFAVAGATMSCEKSEIVEQNKENNELTPGSENNTNSETDDKANSEVDVKMLIGKWTYTAIADKDDQFNSHSDYVFRFWEDGTGYLTIDGYNKEEVVYSLTRSNFSYWVKNERLYVLYAHNADAIEWEFRFKNDELIMRSDMDEYNNIFTFKKSVDADERFMGDWSTTKMVGEKYIDQHIEFVTPNDCLTYSIEYSDPNQKPDEVNAHPQWYKYEFDNNTITITDIENGGTSKKEYKIEDTKLYLNGECYSNFKKENGLE